MNRVYRKKAYPVREAELPWIKRARVKGLRGIIGSDEPVIQNFELGVLEYVMLIVMYECNIHSMMFYIDLVIKYGAISVSISYICLTAVLTMPLHMLLTFLGSYSKRSYLTMFTCAPLFEGLGYVIGIIRIFTELPNSTIASVALIVVYHCMTNNFKATFCKGIVRVDGDNEECLTMHPKTPYNFTCDNQSVRLLTATQYYLKKEVVAYSEFSSTVIPTMNITLLNGQVMVWLLIFVLAVNGIKLIRTIIVNVQFILGFAMTSILLLALFHGHSRPLIPTNVLGDNSSWLSFNFWSEMILYTVGAQSFANLIWLSTIKPRNLDPKFAIILTTQIKVIVYGLLACVAAMIYQEILYHYMIEDYRCVPINGFDVLFSFIPDILYRGGIHNLIIPIWYTTMMYFSFITPMYTSIGLVDTITQKINVLNKYKFYVCLTICSVCFLLNLCLIVDLGGYIWKTWESCAMPLVSATILLLLNIALFFTYSNKNIIEDYLFSYGLPPEKYWLTFWKTSPIFGIFAFIFVCYNQYKKTECTVLNYVTIFSYIQSFCLFLPVVFFCVFRCCTHVKSTELSNISKPLTEWGPYDPVQREKRKLFYPQREIRYRTTTLKCKHRCCCSFTTNYDKKCRIEREKFEQLERQYENEKNDGGSLNYSNEDLTETASIISTDSSILNKAPR